MNVTLIKGHFGLFDFFLTMLQKRGCGNKYELQDLSTELSMDMPRLRLGVFVALAMKEPLGSLFLGIMVLWFVPTMHESPI